MRQVAALLVGAMGLVSIAHGGAPLSTDDAGVLEPQVCEVETYVAGAGFRHEGTALVLVASHALGAGVTAHANLGWAHSQSARASSTTWNLAAEALGAAGVELMAEVYGDDRDRPWRGLAARGSPAQRLSIGIS